MVKSQERSSFRREVSEIDNKVEFLKNCGDNNRFCFIGLLNGNKRFSPKKLDKKLMNQLEVLKSSEEELLKSYFDITVNWIDCFCFPEVMQNFYINGESLPVFIGIDTQTEK